MSSYETWKTTSPAYAAYRAASRRCTDAMAGISIEPDISRKTRSIRGYWLTINGKSVYSERKTGTFQTEQGARAHALTILGLAPAKPAPVPAPLAAGWSHASQRRGGTSPDGGVSAFLGLASHVQPGSHECHYCGLDRRTCDCH